MYKIKPLTVLAVVAQMISIYYSFKFFNDINTFFGLLIVLFEATLFIYLPRIKEAQNWLKPLMITIVVIVISFSILGVVSNGYNFILEDNQKQFRTITNDKHDDYMVDKKDIEDQRKNYQDQLDKYPTLQSFLASSPTWEDKTAIINNYSLGKQKLQDNITQCNDKLGKLKAPSKTITVKIKTSGYNAMLDKINKITGIKVENCILILTLIIAIILQLIILTARVFSKTSLGQNILENKSLGHPRTPEKTMVSEIEEPEIVLKSSVLENEIPRIPEKIIDSEVSVLEKNKSLGQNILDSKTTFDNVLGYLRDTYKQNECIEKFQVKFNLSEYDYKKIREQLVNNKIIETKNRRMYFIETKLKRVK